MVDLNIMPTHGGPAGTDITSWVEKKANEILENKLKGVMRMRYEKALRVSYHPSFRLSESLYR